MDFLTTPATTTVEAFEAALEAARAAARDEAAVDAEIAFDHGAAIELDEDLALDYLEESETFGAISSPEIRTAYRAAYVRAFINAI